jgi:hypothetical protein
MATEINMDEQDLQDKGDDKNLVHPVYSCLEIF